MKYISACLGIALIPLLNAAPCLALNELPSSQSSQPKVTKVAGLLNDVVDTVERERKNRQRRKQQRDRDKERERVRQERLERQEARERASQERMEAYEKRQEERKAAQRAAIEKRRLQAERQRQYFESLSPEEQKAYVARQRAAQQQQMNLLFGILSTGAAIDSFMGGSGSGATSTDYTIIRDDRTYTPAPQPAPAPVQPISPFYGNGPSY
ncbi:MAG: DUF1682 domain-containing protein [Richelia sp. RM2_1_2]|nr:DUF1682 domain-containing protein [Richelia sp. RM2_1_2]